MLRALSAFFLVGALAAGWSTLTLIVPGTPLDIAWRLNPQGHAGLRSIGAVGTLLMASVSVACLLAAYGLWIRTRWARRLALGILLANATGDLMNTVMRGDLRTLLGVPVAGALVAYLCLPRVRNQFPRQATPVRTEGDES